VSERNDFGNTLLGGLDAGAEGRLTRTDNSSGSSTAETSEP
jgi:hypothetical protein